MAITMSNEILFLSLVIFMAISVTGWLLARRQAVQPANANLAASTWGGIMGQMQQQLETRDAKILILETEGSQLRAEVNTLRNEVQVWQVKATELQTALEVFTRQLGDNQRRMNALEHEMATLQAENQRLKQISSAPTDLRILLTTRMDTDEMRVLCQDLKVDYESLAGEGHAAKILALIDYMTRRNDRELLIKTVKRLRPDIPI